MSQTLVDDMKDWVEEAYERIYAAYRKNGTELKGGLPIAQALEEAYRKWWDDVQTEAEEYARRLTLLRRSMDDCEWLRFCGNVPEAFEWFDNDGKVLYDP